MRSLSILSDKALDESRHNCLVVDEMDLYGSRFHVALLELEDPYFAESDLNMQHLVLVRKKAFSLNFREKGIVMGNRVKLAPGGDTFFKMELGAEFVGEVIRVGKSVSALKPGERVIPNGQYPSSAPFAVPGGLPTNSASSELEIFHELQLISVPPELDDNAAASFTIGAQTAYSIIRRLALAGNERVLVTAGSSNTSLFCLAALKSIGINVTVLTSQKLLAPKLLQLGATAVICEENRASVTNNAVLTGLKNNGDLFDVIIDPFADVFMPQLIDYTKTNGQYITCGFYHQSFKSEINNFSLPQFLVSMIVKNITFMGNCLGETADLLYAINDYKLGKLNVVIDSCFNGDNIKQFLSRSFAESGRLGKVVYHF